MIHQRIIYSLLFFVSALVLSAQQAPNFTVTDSWGHTQRLYEDYLDQGKTVVIEVFFAACPPCNAIAPFMEPLYQTWGAGQADVQFIELSILQSDTDTKVNTYKSNHNTTYPAAGGQGGSVAAVAPYTSGMFGQYTGTPTFVVISPDKTVNYNVSGVNITGTINAIDAAIKATGATGLNTGTSNPTSDRFVRLTSNLSQDEIVLEGLKDASGTDVSIINPMGQLLKSEKFNLLKGELIHVDISFLPSGIWICRIEEKGRQRMASYLFVKP